MVPLLLVLAAALQDVEALRKAGDELIEAGDYKRALLKFEKALASAPDRADVYMGRGRALMGLELYEDAEKDFNRALELDPTLGPVYFLRGQLRSRHDADKEALADYDQSLERGFRDPRVFGFMGYSLNKLGRHADAVAVFSKQLSAGPSEMAYRGRAMAKFAQGDLCGAISDDTRSIDLDPANPENYYWRGLAYFGEESWDNALRDLRKCVAIERVVRDFSAHWIFLCRRRMGQKDAAIQELREFIKSTSEKRDASSWYCQLLALDLGEVSDGKVLEMATDNSQLAAAHFAIATRDLADGKSEEALAHLQKASKFSFQEGLWGAALAAAEIRCQWRQRLEGIVQPLEEKVRKLPPFEATYDLDIPWGPDAETAARSFSLIVDMQRKHTVVVARGRHQGKKLDYAMWMQMLGEQLYSWFDFEDSFFRTDFSFVPRTIANLEQEVARLLPPSPDAKPKPDDWMPNFSLQLAGKPSKEEEGTIRLCIGMADYPCNWLKELPGPEGSVREEKDDLVFEFPTQRKKVIIDLRTGLLKKLETLDYDGTRRTIRLTSYKTLDVWPKIDRPAKEKPAPYDVARFKTQMMLQEDVLQGQVSSIVQRWEDLIRGKKEDQAAAIVTRWAAQYSDGFHASAVRTLAGRQIQEALDHGTPVSVLVNQAEADARQFAAQVTENRKEIDDFLNSNLAELADRTETGLFESLIDSRLHDFVRALIRKALDPQAVERQRKATFGDRLEKLYREELATRGSL